MKSSRKDIINVGLLIQDDFSRALKTPCLLYQEAGMCKVVQVDDHGAHIKTLTSVYDAKTLYKVVLDLVNLIQGATT